MIFACQCSLGELEFYAVFKSDILDLNPSPPPKMYITKKMIFFLPCTFSGFCLQRIIERGGDWKRKHENPFGR